MATAAPPDRGRLPERPELAGRCVMWLTADADCAAEADALAHTHGLTRAAVAPADGWHLHLDAQAPELSGPRGLGLPSLRLDLVAAARALERRGRESDPLRRALRLRPPARRVVDATAGLLGDAAALAQYGFEVVALERHPLIAALGEAALRRARAAGIGWCERLRLEHADARPWLAGRCLGSERPDLVYLDPMFGQRRGSALPNARLRLLAALADAGHAGDDLLAAARAAALRRVVVKRPLRAAALGDVTGAGPHHSLAGRAVRFDVYLPLDTPPAAGG